MSDIINFIEVEEKVLSFRGQQVLIDRDIAELYGVSTKEVNQAVKNNPDKFLDGYIVVLCNEDKSELVKNFDRFSTLKHSTVLPSAFTEKGLYMLATILKSPKATQTTIAIVETFTKIRELSKAINQIPNAQEENQQKALMRKSGEILTEIFDDNALEISGDETSFELNLAIMKIKHTKKRERRKK